MLQQNGHTVRLLSATNHDITGFLGKLQAAANATYSRVAKKMLAAELSSFRPDVVHVHNFFPLLSPSVYYACREANVPVVQTLHNFRLLCPNAMLFRDGRVCNECVNKLLPWPGIVHACYRGSRAGTAAVAAMSSIHTAQGTWKNAVGLYIAPSEFLRSKLIEGGFTPEKIVVKPNFVNSDLRPGNGSGEYALFVGRLTCEKGIDVLLETWKELPIDLPLKIVGDGPLLGRVTAAGENPRIQPMGLLPRREVLELMSQASFLVFPSQWYETFGLVVAEAFAAGLPVIASKLGCMETMVRDGQTGLHFPAGDASELAAKVRWAVAHPQELARMRANCRAEFEAKYTPAKNYQQLLTIYQQAMNRSSDRVLSN